MFFKVIKHSQKASSKAAHPLISTEKAQNEESKSTTSQFRGRSGMLLSNTPTPTYTLYTNCGSLPGLLPTLAPCASNLPLQLVLCDLYHLKEIIDKYTEAVGAEGERTPLTQYLNLPAHHFTLMTSGAAGMDKVGGHPKQDKLELKQKDTTISIQPQDYINALKTFKPTIFTTPAQSIVSESSKKKRERAVKVSREYINDSLVDQVATPVLSEEDKKENDESQTIKSNMLMTISIEESYRQISDIIYEKISQYEAKTSGYFFNTHSLEDRTRNDIFKQFFDKYAGSDLEDKVLGKLRMLETDGNPISVLHNLIFNGIDVFESRYPFMCVDKHLCLDIDTRIPDDYEQPSEDLASRFTSNKYTPKVLPLNMEQFRKDSTLLGQGKNEPEYTHPECKSITRAYIYHLIDCNEMNGSILLSLHNLHVYEKFFEAIRANLEKGEEQMVRFAHWFLDTQCEHTSIPVVNSIDQKMKIMQAMKESLEK